MVGLKVAILVPRRSDGGHRDRLWEHCRGIWEKRHPAWEIVEGHHDIGNFNRSAAINLAAAKAGGADVFLIIDGDVICDPRCVTSAVEAAVETGRMVVAHDERVMLNRQGTEKVLGGYTGPWRVPSMLERVGDHGVWRDSVSCAVAVTPATFEAAGGFDELFDGWGREDTAFRIACEVVSGPILKVAGETFHLWHPPAPGVDHRSEIRKRNEARHRLYVGARWDREAVMALVNERHQRAVELGPTTIPRIMHRTVPERTTEEVEGFWAKAAQLHPHWDLRTHREPIDPRDWPLTGDLFDRCQNGAQKAGLIRLEAIWTNGGVYLDSDFEPFRSFEPLLHTRFFAGWEDETTVPDFCFGAEPEHPVVREMIAKARAVIEGGGDAWQSGPGVFTEVLPGRPDVLLMPPGAFAPYHYLAKAQRRNVTPDAFPWAFGAHHWHHSWGTNRQRRDIARRQRA